MLFTAYFLLEFQIVSIYLCQLHIMEMECRYTKQFLKGRICTRKFAHTAHISVLIVCLTVSYFATWLGNREKRQELTM
jgi:hypothetical protein